MNISDLWDVQVLVYVGITAVVTVLMLVLLAVLSRRLRVVTSELESVRRDLRLLEEGVRTVAESLKAKPVPRSISEVIGATPEEPEPPDAGSKP
jgi:hypothetical protein